MTRWSRNAETQTVLNVRPDPLLALRRRTAEREGPGALNKARGEEARARRALAIAQSQRRSRRPTARRPAPPSRPALRERRRRRRAMAMCRRPPPLVRFDVLTLFPALFDGFLARASVSGRSRRAWSGQALGHPRLGGRQAQAGGRPPVRGRPGHGPDGPAGRRRGRGGAGDRRAARPPDRP